MNIKDLVKELKSNNQVEAIYLFGSQATGKARPYSDTDICVILTEGSPQKVRKEILSYSSPKIEISIFSELPLYIKYRIFKEGKPQFVKKKLNIHRLNVRTINNYLDFKNLLERHVNGVLI
jgi:uncharacterized protein